MKKIQSFKSRLLTISLATTVAIAFTTTTVDAKTLTSPTTIYPELVPQVKLMYNGKYSDLVNEKGEPVILFKHNGYTYIPVRAVAVTLGKSVEWSDSERTVYIERNFQGTTNNLNADIPNLAAASSESNDLVEATVERLPRNTEYNTLTDYQKPKDNTTTDESKKDNSTSEGGDDDKNPISKGEEEIIPEIDWSIIEEETMSEEEINTIKAKIQEATERNSFLVSRGVLLNDKSSEIRSISTFKLENLNNWSSLFNTKYSVKLHISDEGVSNEEGFTYFSTYRKDEVNLQNKIHLDVSDGDILEFLAASNEDVALTVTKSLQSVNEEKKTAIEVKVIKVSAGDLSRIDLNVSDCNTVTLEFDPLTRDEDKDKVIEVKVIQPRVKIKLQ